MRFSLSRIPGPGGAISSALPSAPLPPHLIQRFEDLDRDDCGILVETIAHVGEALAFARTHAETNLLVHCAAGLGRSAAIGLAIFAERLGEGREAEAVQLLFAQRPQATPNMVVMQIADRLLGRNGRLLGALAAYEASDPFFARRRADRAAFFENDRSDFARMVDA